MMEVFDCIKENRKYGVKGNGRQLMIVTQKTKILYLQCV